ncbi:hypothetical protein EU527_15985 [Candidatus Thorarchaeota archaeon]|nr:MAG: hypothetical protein EU527_15985 [Candidatus Thorarchaeota archaeon]
MNKSKNGVIIIVIIVGALALAPIALYGTQVDVAQVSFDLSVDSPLSAASLADVESLQIPTFNVGMTNARVDISSMTPYEYFLARNTARTQIVGEEGASQAIVEITITFNLTTPSNNSLIFVLTPGSNLGTGESNIETLLGPEDGITTGGVFYLTITISVKVTPLGFDTPVVDLELSPVILNFTVPT